MFSCSAFDTQRPAAVVGPCCVQLSAHRVFSLSVGALEAGCFRVTVEDSESRSGAGGVGTSGGGSCSGLCLVHSAVAGCAFSISGFVSMTPAAERVGLAVVFQGPRPTSRDG